MYLNAVIYIYVHVLDNPDQDTTVLASINIDDCAILDNATSQ